MPKTRAQKEKLLQNYQEIATKAKAIIFAGFSGLKTRALFELRDKLFSQQIKSQVVKNRVFALALRESHQEIPQEILDQPLLVVYSFEDEIMPAKLVYEFSRENDKLQILGGLVDKNFSDREKIKALALLPSREELVMRLVSAIQSPRWRFLTLLRANQIKLIHILKEKMAKTPEVN
jgi:large subunit ribosomal protein L10